MTNLLQKLCFPLVINLLVSSLQAQIRPDVLFFKDNIQPLAPDNIFKTEGYYNWCSSIVRTEDGKYYLYYCSTNFGSRDYTNEELTEIAAKGSAHPDWFVLSPNQRTGVAV